jgi:hypothetical protein
MMGAVLQDCEGVILDVMQRETKINSHAYISTLKK